MVKKRFLFEIKIIISILTAVLIVGIIGLLAYKSMSAIIDNISEEAKPDIKLAVLKNILSDLSDAESSVKSYSITDNNDYLTPFYQSISSIDDKIDILSQLSRNEKDQQPIIDSISVLVEEKFIILNEMLLNQEKNNRVEETLKKISDKLNEATAPSEEVIVLNIDDAKDSGKNISTTPVDQVEIIEEKKDPAPKDGFFNKLFGKKTPKTAPEKIDESIPKSNIITKIFGKKSKEPEAPLKLEPKKSTLAENNPPKIITTIKDSRRNATSIVEVKEEVTKIKRQEAQKALDNMRQQLELTRKDKMVMDKIRVFISKLEEQERKAIAEKTVEAEEMADKANLIIEVFCIVVSILLFVLGYIIIGYTRKAAAYSKALKKAKVEAENLALSKESFLSNMSHEIRTPMNAIAGFTEQVLGTTLKREQKEQLEIVKKSADHLLDVINDILEFSKLGAGKVELEKIHFQPHKVMEDVFSMIKSQATEKHLALIYSIDKNTPQVLIGDPMRLKQILINLISNAIKFTERGEVKVHIAPVLQNNENTRLQITVLDTGIGIPQKKLSSIFNAFEQAEKSTTRKYGGTGLGLSITKKLIDLQHGTIQIRSEEGRGTAVIFTIPYLIGNTEEVVESDSQHLNYGIIRDKKILVADDEEYNRILLAAILKKWRITYTEVANGQEAVDELKRNHYDLVLMDVRMPVMNGIEATQYLRTKFPAEKSSIPVLALTAATSKESIAQCMDAGMNDVLHKPFTEKELFEKILSIFKLEKNTLVHPKESIMLLDHQPSVQEEAAYNLSEIYNLSNGDRRFVSDMIEMFIRTTEEGLEEIRKGMEENSWETVTHYAHKIASPCRHIEAHAMFRLLKEIEEKSRESQETKPVANLVLKLEQETTRLLSLLKKELSNSLA